MSRRRGDVREVGGRRGRVTEMGGAGRSGEAVKDWGGGGGEVRLMETNNVM